MKKEKLKLEVEFLTKLNVEHHIEGCEGKHIQQIAYSSYHDALTQVCFGCGVIRTSLKKEELEK